MRKKSFLGGFDLLLGEEQSIKEKNNLKKDEEVRATFLFVPQQLADIRSIAYWERKKLKEIMREALYLYIDKYIKEKGEIEKN